MPIWEFLKDNLNSNRILKKLKFDTSVFFVAINNKNKLSTVEMLRLVLKSMRGFLTI